MNIQTLNTESASYYMMPTPHKGFVMGHCLVPMGTGYAEYNQRMLPVLLARMLGLGTQSMSEEEINFALESKGISINFSYSFQYIVASFVCMTPDFELVASLIAKQLQEPLCADASLSSLKQRLNAQYLSQHDDTGARAQQAFNHALYPEQHMNHWDSFPDLGKLLEQVSSKQIQSYHQLFDTGNHAKWIVVGDFDHQKIESICSKHLKPAEKKQPGLKRELLSPHAMKAQKIEVQLLDKQSVDVRIGHTLPIDCHHPDYLPLRIAIDALGGGFSARLMRTVRDEEGLTYGVNSVLGGFYINEPGHWAVHATFSPQLLSKGIASIEKQLKLWKKSGISQQELDERKAGLIGKYAVAGSDASSIASQIRSIIEQGYDLDYFFSYPEKVQAVTLEQVNHAMKQYIHLDKLTHVYAGTL